MTSPAAYRAQSRHLTNGTRILNGVAAAMFAAQWKREAVTGRLHALIGGNSDKLVNGAGRIFFVVLTAAARTTDMDTPDMRILRGAIEALHDQAGEAEVSEVRRAGIVSGLQACDRLMVDLSTKDLAEAALYMEARLRPWVVSGEIPHIGESGVPVGCALDMRTQHINLKLYTPARERTTTGD